MNVPPAPVLVVVHLAALWPSVRWYVTRTTDGAGDMWGLAALAAAVSLTLLAPQSADARADRAPAPRLLLSTTLVAAQAVAWTFLPPLLCAAIGAASLVALVSELRFGSRMVPGLLGLALLSLPSISTLQFFIGWPFRVAVGAVVAPVLSGIGIDAVHQGTSLVVAGRAIAVDAPCSGVWMLWGAVLVWLCVAMARRLPARATITGLATVLPIVFAANALRTLCLVLVATRPGTPSWVHEGVGIVVLAAATAAVVLLSERSTRCAAPSST